MQNPVVHGSNEDYILPQRNLEDLEDTISAHVAPLPFLTPGAASPSPAVVPSLLVKTPLPVVPAKRSRDPQDQSLVIADGTKRVKKIRVRTD
jgi:hypothetical protein